MQLIVLGLRGQNLVDPGNLRPVDFQQRIPLLDEVKAEAETDLPALINGVLQNRGDGRIEFWLVFMGLRAGEALSLCLGLRTEGAVSRFVRVIEERKALEEDR